MGIKRNISTLLISIPSIPFNIISRFALLAVWLARIYLWLAAFRVLRPKFVRLIGGILKNQNSTENKKFTPLFFLYNHVYHVLVYQNLPKIDIKLNFDIRRDCGELTAMNKHLKKIHWANWKLDKRFDRIDRAVCTKKWINEFFDR